MKVLESYGGVVLIAGFLCYLGAFALICLAPAILTEASVTTVVDVHGNVVEVPAYTEAEARGRDVYIQEMCWHCHSQFVRPVNEEDQRWGPVSQAGESAIDRPHLYGTRRTGPDLAREGGRRVDDWQYAHLYDPRATVSDSVMPGFPWYFEPYGNAAEIEELVAQLDSDGDGIVSNYDDKTWWPEGVQDRLASPLLDNGGVLAPDTKQTDTGERVRAGTYRDVYTAIDKGDGVLSDYDARPRPTQEAQDLIAYLQRLGTAIGPWRKPIVAPSVTRTDKPPMRGVEVAFTYRTPEGEEETIDLRVPDGQMPLRARAARRYGLARSRADELEVQAAEMLQDQYEVLMTAWRQANPIWDQRLREGEALYARHCASCHGEEGRGNGIAAPHLLIRPRDFTIGKYRYRSTQVGTKPLDGDLYRSLYRGLWGSSMPSWKHLPEEQLWLLVDYIKSFQEVEGAGSDPMTQRSVFPPELTADHVIPPEYDLISKALAIPTQPEVPARRLDRHLARGRAVYMVMKCANCHGSEGRGDGPGWNTTFKDNGGLLRPRDFPPRGPGDDPALRYRGGASAEAIYRTIFTGLDGGNMPSSYDDFENAWRNAAELDATIEQGASEDEIAAAREKARRAFLFSVPGGADLPGVVEIEEDGKTVQYLEKLEEGDDWALVHYVMSLSGIPIPTVR